MRPVVIAGPSGVGKGTLIKMVMDHYAVKEADGAIARLTEAIDKACCGGSADGVPGNMAVLGDPSRLKGEWLIWTASNAHSFSYPQGVYRESFVHGYLVSMAPDTRSSSRDLVLPQIESKESYDSWWAAKTMCHDLSNPSECYYDRINWPIVDSAGWWDIFQDDHLSHWKGIRTMSNVSVRDQHVLFVGPLGHCLIGEMPWKPYFKLAYCH